MQAAVDGDTDKVIAPVTGQPQNTANFTWAEETAFPDLAA